MENNKHLWSYTRIWRIHKFQIYQLEILFYYIAKFYRPYNNFAVQIPFFVDSILYNLLYFWYLHHLSPPEMYILYDKLFSIYRKRNKKKLWCRKLLLTNVFLNICSRKCGLLIIMLIWSNFRLINLFESKYNVPWH